jgi:DNA polymerase-4
MSTSNPHLDRHREEGPRRILHLDVDAFLAAVECALHPKLRGRPLVIGGLAHERNLVMSSSYEARAFGVRSGLLLAEAQRLCPTAIFRRGDSQAAARLGHHMAQVVMRFTPQVQVTSCDDFLADVSGSTRLFGAAFEIAQRIRAAVWNEVELPITVGIGSNITIARLAGKLAKPGGVAEIWPGYEATFLRGLPVEHLPGVGYRTRRLLERFAIRTAGDLRSVSREVLFASFGQLGLVLHDRAGGLDERRVEPTWIANREGLLVRRAPKSIRRDGTFEPEESSRRRVEAMLAYLVDRAMSKLRSAGLQVVSLAVNIRYVDTRPPSLRRAQRAAAPAERAAAASENATRRVSRSLDGASDSTDRVAAEARAMLRSLPRRRALVKRVGIELTRLRPAAGWQGTLFSQPAADRAADSAGGAAGSHADRQRQLDDVLDGLRERIGFGRVLRGSSLPLCETHELKAEGFRLRTPSLNQ